MKHSITNCIGLRLFTTRRVVPLMLILTLIATLTTIRAAVSQEASKSPRKTLPKAGVVMTFDDSGNIPRWTAQIPLFKKYGVRPTFFLNAPESMPGDRWTMLQQLREMGAALGAHGKNHVHSVTLINKVGIQEFVRQEIEPVHTCLKNKGISIHSFAYPMSQHNEESDQCLFSYYGHLRSGAGLKEGQTLAETDIFFTPRTEIHRRLCLIGKGCDGMDDETLQKQIYPALERAKKQDEILVLYAHNIADHGKGHMISPVMLEKIFRRAAELDLAFYSYDDLPPYEPEEQTVPQVQSSAGPLHIQPEQIISQGSDGTTCWTHARAACTPRGLGLMTAQKLLLTGSDVFYAIHSSISEDGGRTWSTLTELPGFGRIFGGDDQEAIPCDGTPAYHAASGKILVTGHLAFYEKNRVTKKSFPLSKNLPAGQVETKTWYAVFDPVTRTWQGPKFLTVPTQSKAKGCGAGCTQRFDLPDGTILLPVYGENKRTPKCAKAVVIHCKFDGTTLTWLEEGKPLELSMPRGFDEPSLIGFEGRFYLTLRNDTKGYVAVSDDGLNYSTPIAWCWSNGEEIGNYNTQQHWLTTGGKLALVYTRRSGNNDHVFRHRAPLFCALVDPKTLSLDRSTEMIAVPERGARLGNFGITKVSPDESWIVVSEWMQSPRGGGPKGYNDCTSHGATGAIWKARVTVK